MSYVRVNEAGTYIWTDGENVHFDLDEVPEDKINIFIAKLFDDRPVELQDRINKGRKLVKDFEVKSNEYKDI